MDTAATLKEAGLRATPERVALLEALRAAAQPVSSKDLHANVAGTMDRVTVYRVLEALVSSGLARTVDIGHRHAHYEALDSEHHHLICSSCGKTEDITYCPPDATVQRLLDASAHFAAIDRHTLEFYGTCTACAVKR